MGKAYRYPGVKPFTEKEAHLFFGRKGDITKLSRFIRTEDLVVLHGKSGLGKSSLINAGILPLVEEQKNNNFIPLQIRLRSYNPNLPQNLFEIFNQGLTRESNFIDEIPTKFTSLWHGLKSREYADLGEKPKRYLLILDQFEELFSYPQEEYMKFGQELASLFNRRMPPEFRKLLRHEKIGNPEFEKRLADEKLEEWIDQPVELKILIAIRTDKFNLLDKFSSFLPEILLNAQLLEPFTKTQAKLAIQNPAKIEGSFDSPPFSFEKPAMDKVLDFLASESNGQVEGFQLQIICRNIEENIIKFHAGEADEEARMSIKKRKAKKGEPVYTIEDVNADFGDILRRYYDEQIKTLETEEQELARNLIEDQLIADDRRVSLDQAIIQNFVDEELLVKLVDTRLIRREPNNLGGFSYEISHDTLLAPVLEARGERWKQQEQKERREKAKEAAKLRDQELQREREEKEKELTKMRAERAELDKERALKAKKEERKFKYLLGAVLVVLGIYTTVLFFQFRALTKSEIELNKNNKLLKDKFGLSKTQLDSVNKRLEQLPVSSVLAIGNNLILDNIKNTLENKIKADSSNIETQFELANGKLQVEAHIFPPGATSIPANSVLFLKSLVSVANTFPNYGINIEVHTDDSGESDQNLRTSFYRASLIGNLLVDSLSYDAERLHLAGKGESSPLIPIETKMISTSKTEARNQNRRVNLIFFPL